MKLNTLLIVCFVIFGVLETISALRKHQRGGRKHRHGNRGTNLPYGPPGMQMQLSGGPPGWKPNVHSPERFFDRVVGPPAAMDKLASLTDVGAPATMEVKPPGVRPPNSPVKLQKLGSGPPAHMAVGPPAGPRVNSPVIGPPATNYGKSDSIIGPPAGPPGGLTHQDMKLLEPGCPPGESISVVGGCVPKSQNIAAACPPGSNPDSMGIGCMPENANIDINSYMRNVHGNSDPIGPTNKDKSASIIGPPAGN